MLRQVLLKRSSLARCFADVKSKVNLTRNEKKMKQIDDDFRQKEEDLKAGRLSFAKLLEDPRYASAPQNSTPSQEHKYVSKPRIIRNQHR
jgi:hypothetical protein